MLRRILAIVKRALKRLLRHPADILVLSSEALAEEVEARIARSFSLIRNPYVSAKFFPYQSWNRDYVLKIADGSGGLAGSEFPVHPSEIGGRAAAREAGRGSYETVEDYLSSGRTDVGKMREIVRASDFVFEDASRILDFGCGHGRMIRWLNDISKKCEIWGVDVRDTAIVWCQQYLSPPFKFATTTTYPHLPFEDRHFDLVYAGSVFTHIADLADAWLLELKRILRPGGKLYVTVHDNHTVEVLLSREYPVKWLKEVLVSHQSFVEPGFAMFTVGGRTLDGAQVFYDIDHVCQKWGRILKVLSVTRGAYGHRHCVGTAPAHQTAILMEK